MVERNKRRLYVAFFRRKPTRNVPVKFHTALIVARKSGLWPSSDSDIVKKLYLYEAINRIDPSTSQDTWFYEVTPLAEIPERVQKLSGLMFVGKLPASLSDEELRNMLDNDVPRKKFVADDLSWRCHTWIWDALTLLVSRQLIPALPKSPEQSWRDAIQFMDDKDPPSSLSRIPCCDESGKALANGWI
ncbi:hypothetical protein BDQ12DRAFT_633630 [Crucibulum laeve]|uniref:Uncharacterized protein n=1 Tax=Crucibulum laeve TaxID=68775 RepID=A0A5C3LX89_9AGAR|nr:hypothetical protein BDQ12DRAFT_633630 [Crucibulum laeve]